MAVTPRDYADALRLARAAGTDAGNRSARRHGRTVWADTDHDAACDALHAALDGMGYPA